MASGHLTLTEFDRVVSEALESLPKRSADLVENVVVPVEEEPTVDDLESIEGDVDGDSDLLASIAAHRLPSGRMDMPLLPDEIAVFRGPINRVTRSRREAMREVRVTVDSGARPLLWAG
jgi:predicted Zn-dependent protease with MMP-like domain